MNASEELRRMLDECGVEWWPLGSNMTECVIDGIRYKFRQVGRGLIVSTCTEGTVTPEQAIAATLSSCNCTNSERTGTCHNASKVMDEHGQARFACSECGAWIDSRMLWNPEYRNGESPWVSGCKLNFCPNCGRRIVGPTTDGADAEVDDG